jgi:hypothetical protein
LVTVLVLVVIFVAVAVLAGWHTSGEAGGRIRQDHEAPPGRGQTFATIDVWLGTVAGHEVVVYAGAKTLPGTGTAVRSELLLYRPPSEGHAPVFEGAFAPPGGGREPLRITAAHGDVLTVEARGGHALRLDVATRRFT